MDFIVFLIIASIAIFLIYVARLPSAFRITRYASISAPLDLVFEHVNDFHLWQAWSPWARIDPDANTIFEGPVSGVGAKFRWSGNKHIGAGNMTIIESQVNELIKIRLEFIRPQPGISTTEFTFEPDEGNTLVSWSMSGHNNFITRAVCTFVSMDKIVGGMFEQGLNNLRAVLEASPEQTNDK
jgi:hypothetical protein